MSNQTVHFKNIRAKIIETLETANSEVLIAVAWFTDEKIIKVLNELSLNGVSISIVFYDDRINNKDLFKTLYYRKANINVSKKLMHNKFCIIDREIVINGSYNWAYNASTNDENIQITKHNDELVDSFVEQFYELKEKSKSLEVHFKYSISNILEEIENFEYDFNKNIRGKTKTPYFYKIDDLNIHPIHKDVKLKNEIVIVKDLNEEYIIFFLLFFLKREFPLLELSKVTTIKYKIPETYSTVNNEDFDSNKFIPLTNSRNILKSNFFKKELLIDKKDIFDVSIINLIGDKVNFFKECYELPDGFFITNYTSYAGRYFVFDYDFNQILVNEVIIDYIVGFGCVIRKYIDNCKRYLLYNVIKKEFLQHDFLHYYEYNLRSYLFSVILEYAKKTVSLGLVDNKPLRYEERDALIYYKIINDEKRILIKDFYELDSHIKQFDKRITFFELPCLEKTFYEKTQIPIIHSTYYTFGIDYPNKEILYDIDLKKIIYGAKNKNGINKYFYSDNGFKYQFFFEIVVKKKYELLYSDFIQTIDIINSKLLNKTDGIDEIEKYVNHRRQHFNDRIKWYNNQIKKDQKSCYIATMVYEDINHPKVELLRQFRDNVLIKSFFGKVFIKYYYQYSPDLVEKLKNYKKTNYIIKKVLDLIVKIIK